MACIVMAYIVMACIVVAYIVMACIVRAYTPMAYIVMACVAMAHIVMACIVRAVPSENHFLSFCQKGKGNFIFRHKSQRKREKKETRSPKTRGTQKCFPLSFFEKRQPQIQKHTTAK